VTRKDNSAAFHGEDNVPKHAITMGISTILNARRVILMAWSENKANIVQRTIEGPKSIDIPATLLHDHNNCTFYLDRPASEKLSRFVHPWNIRGDFADPEIVYDNYWTVKAVIWLSNRVQKPILRLTYKDYEDNKLS
jgi:glucosamine-6-phosphate deaminase